MDYAEPPHEPEPVTTIAWRMAHMIVNFASSSGKRLGPAGLAKPQGYPPAFTHAPMAKNMLDQNVEVIHHGAEICLFRNLYLHNWSGRS